MQQPKLTWTPNPALQYYGTQPPVTKYSVSIVSYNYKKVNKQISIYRLAQEEGYAARGKVSSNRSASV